MEHGKISCIQTIYLLANLVTATAVIFLPAVTAHVAGRDAWLAPVATTLPGVYLALVIASLGKRYPGQTLMQYLQKILGTWPGLIVGGFYIFYFLHTNALIIRQFGELLGTIVLPRTPMITFYITMLLLCAWAIRGGLEIIARIMELAFPQIVIFFTVIIALTMKDMDFNNLLPVLEDGFLPILRSSVALTGWRGEIILLAMFLPFMAKPKLAGRCAIGSVILIGLILVGVTIAHTAVFGPTVPRLTFPTFSLIRQIEALDALLVIIWVISMFGKIALFYYVAAIGCAQLANLKDYRPVVLPLGIILTAFTLRLAAGSQEIVYHITIVWPSFSYVFEYIIPTLLLVIAVFKGKKNGENGPK